MVSFGRYGSPRRQRPLHHDEALALQVFHKALGDDRRQSWLRESGQ
jgi:hypothetical protein